MRHLLLALTLLATLTMTAQTPTLPHVRSVASLRDHYRPLLVLSPTPSPAFCDQVEELARHAHELHERQVAIYYLLSSDAAGNPSCSYPQPDINTFAEPRKPNVNGEHTLFHAFQADPTQFTVILIGKDGGEKLRSNKPISFTQLQQTIDAMPMRRQEMSSQPRP